MITGRGTNGVSRERALEVVVFEVRGGVRR
jgi:hypothetical protein